MGTGRGALVGVGPIGNVRNHNNDEVSMNRLVKVKKKKA